MKKLVLFLASLEKRERFILIAGLYSVILIVGIFFITLPLWNRIERLDRRIIKETENYTQLIKLVSEYISYRPSYEKRELTLSFIENLARKNEIKENITSLKPFQKGSIEITLEKVDGKKLSSFIKDIKKKNLRLLSFSMNDIKGNKEYNVRMVISE